MPTRRSFEDAQRSETSSDRRERGRLAHFAVCAIDIEVHDSAFRSLAPLRDMPRLTVRFGPRGREVDDIAAELRWRERALQMHVPPRCIDQRHHVSIGDVRRNQPMLAQGIDTLRSRLHLAKREREFLGHVGKGRRHERAFVEFACFPASGRRESSRTSWSTVSPAR